ncbi:MAG: hypothetical protein IJ087_12155 [Eggerthellaceae bacterium]|nr:hypothetical protein [Eggerthellaceae bacterium]
MARTFVAIPCFDTVDTLFFSSYMNLEQTPDMYAGMVMNAYVHDARNMLANWAIEDGFDRIMWIDDDMVLPKDAILRLAADVDDGLDYVAGLYFTRKGDVEPTIKKSLYARKDSEGNLSGKAEAYADYPRDSLFPVKGSGLGCTMMTVDIVREVMERYPRPFDPIPGYGEDLSFCLRLEELGIPMYCDSRVKCGHVGRKIVTEEDYLAGLVLP